MIKYITSSLILSLVLGCSFKSPPNEWQGKSINAFAAYTKDFMSNENKLAKNDLRRAIKHAKKSADLTTLARVYLGKCALNISVGITDTCQEYKNIAHLVDDKTLSLYFEIITKQSTLPFETILDKSRASSILLNGALNKDRLNSAQRKKLLEVASFHGYKKAVIFWLKESLKYADKEEQKRLFQEKIEAIQ